MATYNLRNDSQNLVVDFLSPSVGLPSGIAALDNETLGFDPGEYVIVAGRPSMGKSSLARNIALSIGHPTVGGCVLLYSLEMSYQEIAELLLANLAKVNYYAIKRGQVTDAIKSRLDTACAHLSTYNIIINDAPRLTTQDIHSNLRSYVDKGIDISCVIVDYIQLISVVNRGNENRQAEMTEISRELLAMAKEFGVPVIAL